MKKNIDFLKIVTFVLAMATSQLAMAQGFATKLSSTQDDELLSLSLAELGNITVTVSDFKETLLNAASTVSIVEHTGWQKLGARHPFEAVTNLPGMMSYPNVSTGWTTKVRGYTNVAPRGVAYRLDGVPLNSYRFGRGDFVFDWMGMTGIDRIEVIRGPGSVHHGSDAFHGVYSVQTLAGDSNYSHVNSEIGSNKYGTIGYQNTSLNNKNIKDFALQINYQGNQNKEYDYTDPTTNIAGQGSRSEQVENFTGLAKIRSNWSSPWKYQGSIYLIKTNASEFPGEGRFFDSGHDQSYLTDQDKVSQDFTFLMGKLDLEYDFGKTITGTWSNFIWDSQTDKTWHASQPGFQKQDNHELRIGSKLTIKQAKNPLNTQWSVAVSTDSSQIISATQTTASGGQSNELYDGKDRQVYTLALQAKTSFFADNFHVDYGVRLDDYDAFGLHTSPRAGLIYTPNQNSAVKLLYGQAFRAPTAAEQFGVSGRAKGKADILPEVINTYELVFMHHLEKLKWDLVLFQSQWSDGIQAVNTTDPNFFKEFDNQTKNSSNGAEMNLHYNNNNWDFDYSTSYIKSRNDSTNTDYVAFPEWIHNLGLGYNLESYNTSFYLSNKIFSNVQENPDTTSSDLKLFWQTNLNIQYQPQEQMVWSLNIRNMFARNNTYPAVQFTENGHPAEPFNVSVSLDYTF
ncbi:MAG: TonB-dependent receptor [Magnetococcales bacterium]|nr:TonB-dependent receptor [Magnetococcales bacterium]